MRIDFLEEQGQLVYIIFSVQMLDFTRKIGRKAHPRNV